MRIECDSHSLSSTKLAEIFWRRCCALAAAHVFGMEWNGSKAVRTDRPATGHWGANPGIAWIAAHLASQARVDELGLLVGTGHASSFFFAHDALFRDKAESVINADIARYCVPGGYDSELMQILPSRPIISGELGSALAQSQAIALHRPEKNIGCVIGDGELETPNSLAALLHLEELYQHTKINWFPVINANGAKMGADAVMSPHRIVKLLEAMGYECVVSVDDGVEANKAAASILTSIRCGRKTAWVSVTDKGWPAPANLFETPFRGSFAHKVPRVIEEPKIYEIEAWVSELANPILGDWSFETKVAQKLARKIDFRLVNVSEDKTQFRVHQDTCAASKDDRSWVRPIEAVDAVLCENSIPIFSPDEAKSNRFILSLENQLVTEVLSEETCASWSIGTAAMGSPAAFVTYEAFASLTSSQIAQYAKLILSDPDTERGSLLIILSSLGWANCPTHQNTDFASIVLARSHAFFRLFTPPCADTARMIASEALKRPNSISVIVSSKQPMPAPGLRYFEGQISWDLSFSDENQFDGHVIAIGDVCVAEAVAAAEILRHEGKQICVTVLAEIPGFHTSMALHCKSKNVIATAWCSPQVVAGSLYRAYGCVFPIFGMMEKFGSTPWETLINNELDRYSIIKNLGFHAWKPAGAPSGEGIPEFSYAGLLQADASNKKTLPLDNT